MTPAELKIGRGLPQLGGRPPLGRYLQKIWTRRHFGIELARSRFRARNAQDRLGIAWVVLNPLIQAAVYGLVFGFLLPSDSRPDNFVAFLVTGIFIFQFFSSSLSDGAKSITSNMGLVRTLHFPRALLPMASVYQQVLALIPMLTVLFVLVTFTGESPSWRWLQVVPAVVLMTMFNTGVAFFTARATISIRDIANLLPFLTRVMFYTSGVFWSIDRVVTEPTAQLIAEANPVHVYMALNRGALIEGLAADLWLWAAAVLWAFVTLVAGFLFFWRAEERYGRE